MQRIYFTHKEARRKVGQKVEALGDFPSVPKGSKGTVVKAQRFKKDAWIACVEWQSPVTRSHFYTIVGDLSLNFSKVSRTITDQFCKSEYEALLLSE